MQQQAKRLQTKSFYEFEGFRVDPVNRLLFRNNEIVPLTAKVFDILLVFVENSGRVLEKDEVMQHVWQDSFVEEGNLTRNVSTLRKALGADPKSHQYIVTIPGRGYQFVAEVREVHDSQPLTIVEELTVSKTIIEEQIELPNDQKAHPLLETKESTNLPFARHSQKRFFILATTGIIVVALVAVLIFRKAPAPRSPSVKSIAVLPLKPVNAENRDQAYEYGIADALILKLSSVKEIIVRPLSATRKYASLEQDPLAAGREQQVDYVLTSNYQLAEGKIRLTSQLIHVEDGSIASVFKCDERCADIFALQDDIAERVGQLLLTRLSNEESNLLAKRYTNNEEAFRLYSQGMYLVERRNAADTQKSIEYFEQATKLDPHYALAYIGLAYARNSNAWFNGVLADVESAKKAAAKALELDANLAEAHVASGVVKADYEWDFSGALPEFKRALELNPHSVFAHRFYGLYLSYFERFDEAIAEIKSAIEIDPTSLYSNKMLGDILYYAHRYDEAIAQYQRVVAMDDHFWSSNDWIWISYEMKGDYEQAFNWYLRSLKAKGATELDIKAMKRIYAQSGWKGILRQMHIALSKKGIVISFVLACISAQLGEKEQAFAYLEQACAIRVPFISSLKVEPRLDPLRSDPRFDELLHRVGLK